jgi:ABC-type antimicrobial peptide transport system permease subunit
VGLVMTVVVLEKGGGSVIKVKDVVVHVGLTVFVMTEVVIAVIVRDIVGHPVSPPHRVAVDVTVAVQPIRLKRIYEAVQEKITSGKFRHT